MIPGDEIGGRISSELGLTVSPTPDDVSGRGVTIDVETAPACCQESTLSTRWAASRVADALLA